ncbi:MAG: hypothetical protein G01um101431_806 [Parcubacteria group bacterium Gr01-1014_31]|nr:MAG: hypothetical protein G01um101431_806 [Parcubacteria group bacterium Gr01-1014_31]
MNVPELMKKAPVMKMSPDGGRPKPLGKSSGPIMVVFILIFAVASLYFFSQWGAAKTQIKRLQAELADVRQNPGKAAREETVSLLQRVGKLMVLPEGEEPTVATVNDPERLKAQPFFAKAKQGDKVLIYTNAKKAILYDPVANLIVEVAPVSFGQEGAAQ